MAEAIEKIKHTCQVYDLGGQERYKFVMDVTHQKIDTETNEVVQSKTYSILQGSNLIVYVIDGTNFEDSINYLNSISKQLNGYNKLFVVTKKDLADELFDINISQLENLIQNPVIKVSNKTGENIDELVNSITKVLSLPGNYFQRSASNRVSKVIFAGLGGAGKTTLLYRIKEDKFLENAKLTIGPNIETFILSYDNKPSYDPENVKKLFDNILMEYNSQQSADAEQKDDKSQELESFLKKLN